MTCTSFANSTLIERNWTPSIASLKTTAQDSMEHKRKMEATQAEIGAFQTFWITLRLIKGLNLFRWVIKIVVYFQAQNAKTASATPSWATHHLFKLWVHFVRLTNLRKVWVILRRLRRNCCQSSLNSKREWSQIRNPRSLKTRLNNLTKMMMTFS